MTSLNLSAFARRVLAQCEVALTEESGSVFLDLAPCGTEITTKLLSATRKCQEYERILVEISALAHETMKQKRHDLRYSVAWRRLYTEAALVWTMQDCLREQTSSVDSDDIFWKNAVSRLDHAIVVAGAPGEGRLDLILDSIEQIQKAHLPLRSDSPHSSSLQPLMRGASKTLISHTPLPSACRLVPCLERTPSLSALRSTLRETPFILRRFAEDWPAVSEHRWASKAYLQSAAGRGRVVPVEVGRDYRTDDWAQRMMEWDVFLDYLFPDAQDNSDIGQHHLKEKEIIYHAQHDLFKQFPMLRSDIVVPDYVYSLLPPPQQFPQYRPPANDDALVLNAWFGPEGTVSPAHTDPYYNFYVQVVGRKTVWLAPPDVSHALSPYSEPAPAIASLSSGQGRIQTDIDPALGNTSRLDVFASADSGNALFRETVVPLAMSATLDAGDMLFFPPGWWHAMRSESISFSVSMWF